MIKLREKDRLMGLSEQECDLIDELLAAAHVWEQTMVSDNRSSKVLAGEMTEEEDSARWETVRNHNGRLVRAVRRVREMLAKP